MALFRIATRKAINTNGIAAKWSNQYYCEAGTPADAVAIAIDVWANGERLMHNALAFCYEVYVNNTQDPPFTPGVVVGVPVGIQRGSRAATAATTGILLPLWNVVRVDQPVQNSRPSRKFYRTPLVESDIENAQLVVDVSNAINTGAQYLANGQTLRDVDGQLYAGAAIVRGLTSRRLGRDATLNVPPAPPFG